MAFSRKPLYELAGGFSRQRFSHDFLHGRVDDNWEDTECTLSDAQIEKPNSSSVSVGMTGTGALLLRSTGYGDDFTITVQTDRDNAEGRTSGLGGPNAEATGEDVDARLFVVTPSEQFEYEVETNGQHIVAGRTAQKIEGKIQELKGLVLRASLDMSTTLANARITVQESPLGFQIGEAASGSVVSGISSARPKNLGTIMRLSEIDVRSAVGASRAIEVVEDALAQVLEERGALGAFQRQFLEPTARNLLVYKENLQAAESNIRDADLASELIEFTKQQILMQAGAAMLAQANLTPQSILELLR